MKRKWPLVLGASIFTGLVGSLALRKNKPNVQENVAEQYIGEWEFYDADEKTTHRLSIQPSLIISIDRRQIKTAIIELTKERLILQDEYGYHLIINISEDQSATLYDEADDFKHPLSAVK